MKLKLIGCCIELFDLLIYILLWASLWHIYGHIMDNYIAPDQVLHVNAILLVVGIVLLVIKNIYVYKYKY